MSDNLQDNNEIRFDKNKYIITPLCLIAGIILAILVLRWIGVGIPFIDSGEKELNFTRFWSVFFFGMSISYIIRIWLIKKHPKTKAGLVDKFLIIGMMPYLFYRMLQNDSLAENINFLSLLAIFSILLGFVFIYLSWKCDKISKVSLSEE